MVFSISFILLMTKIKADRKIEINFQSPKTHIVKKKTNDRKNFFALFKQKQKDYILKKKI